MNGRSGVLTPRGTAIEMSEEELVARCRTGDLEAFSVVYTRYSPQVYRYAYHLMGHREDADDIKQETFLRAHQAIGSFRSEASLQTWLLRICGNLCRDRIKSWERRKVSYDDRISGDGPHQDTHALDPQEVVEQAETRAIVMRALHGMPAPQREIVVLHDIEGLGYPDIARILGCSTASAKLRVFRARRYLKERVTSLLEAR
jgi:RNA polymerase sigma-70 factor, ECF subfamily